MATAATTATIAATPTLPGNLTKYYQALQQELTKTSPQITYNPQSADQIRQNLENAYKAGFDQSVKARKQQTTKNSAMIDADAAARGIGTSTWVTDAKRRQMDSEAADIASLSATKNSTISQQLAAALADQEARRLSVDEYNASNRATAQSNALATAVSMYDKLKAEEPQAAVAGGGYYGGSGGGGGNASKGWYVFDGKNYINTQNRDVMHQAVANRTGINTYATPGNYNYIDVSKKKTTGGLQK